jgi:tetratricopeptide (TPR) repeat protein
MLEARGLSAAELARLADQLGGEAAAQREAAFHALSELHAESLAGIAQRLRALKKSRPDAEAEKAALSAFRHAAGSRRADDSIDIAPGVLAVLGEQRDATVLAVAEPLLYLRSLERMQSREAGLVMAELLVLDEPGVWDAELRLARERVGLPLLPALLELRAHADANVRAFAQAGVHALGMQEPSTTTKLSDPHLVAEVVHAYVQPLDFAAMPLVVRLTGAEPLEVREAARFAVARFGKNAIWQLRQLYEEVKGKSAERSWDAERIARELYAALDHAARADEERLLAQGMSRFVAGDLEAMRQLYDRLLAQSPHFDQRAKLAPGYAALGEKLLAEDKLEPARDAYQRALRLAPTAPDAEALRAELAYIDAELALSHGVVDLHGYEEALRHAPKHAAATAARDRLTGERAARERKQRRLAAGAAIALLLGLIAILLRGRQTRAEPVAPEHAKRAS